MICHGRVSVLLLSICVITLTSEALPDQQCSHLNAFPCRTGAATRRGRRISMEDRVGAWDVKCDPRHGELRTSDSPDFSIWAVFDGHGSSAVSSYLHAALHRHLRSRLCDLPLLPPPGARDQERGQDDHPPPLPEHQQHPQQRQQQEAGLKEEEEAERDVSEGRKGEAGHEAAGHHGQPDRHHHHHRHHQQQVQSALVAALAAADADLQRSAAAKPFDEPGTAGCTPVQATADVKAEPADDGNNRDSVAGFNRGSVGNGDSAGTARCGAGDGVGLLGALAEAAAAAAWEAGSTAVVAVVDWTSEVAAGAAGAAAAGEAAAARDAGQAADAGGVPLGRLWVASVGNSPALLCLPQHGQQGQGQQASAAADNDDARLSLAGSNGGSRAGGSRAQEGRSSTGKSTDSGSCISSGSGAAGRLVANVLSRIHELDDEGERRRVEAAGGRVEEPSRP
ncbi:hypothetical protein Agub_g13603, partial [Astrephomene gubernaculifera]